MPNPPCPRVFWIIYCPARIVPFGNAKGKVSFITKGDNNYSIDDALVLPENIYGKVVTKVPFYSTIKKVISNPLIIGSIIIILLLLIINRSKKDKNINTDQEIELLSFDDEKLEII